MITQDERADYRAALKQYQSLIDLVEGHLIHGTPINSGVALALEKMTDTVEPANQMRALESMFRMLDTQYDEQLRYAAQYRFSPFCEYMFRNEPPAMHHEFLIDHMEAIHNGEIVRLAISMPPGAAKALALDTPIPTPAGWKLMGELRVGDEVFDENGDPCNVTWVSPVWTDRNVYAVTTDCGDVIIADEEHEWLVRLCGKHPVEKIKETRQLAKKRSKRPMITRAKALNLPEVALPVDPYVLGAWLGDGDSAGTRMTASVTDMPFIRAEFERRGYTTTTHKCETNFGVTEVRSAFVALNLICDRAHATDGFKHIPEQYMRASYDQRLALLQGLCDTDGTVCRKRGSTTFCNTNKNLAIQVRELVRSLGVKAGWSEGRAMLRGKDCGPVFRVSFYLENSTLIPRKAALTRNQDRTPKTYISVEPMGRADTVCIEVDSDSHLFLCGHSMTPTHNSSYASIRFAAWHLGRRPNDRWLQGAHTQTFAKDRLGKPVRNLINDTRYKEVFPEMGLSASSAAADYFEFVKGQGYYKAVGVGVGISGFRADIAAIDDPVASREDADSPTSRRKLHAWFEDDFGTRPMPGSPVYVVATRWHEDDLIGHELDKMQNGITDYKWEVINIPAIAVEDDPLGRPEGQGLWPEVFGTDWYLAKKRGITGRSWNSLYQGVPTDEEGGILKREDVSHYTTLPKDKVRQDGTMVEKVIRKITLSVDCAEKATQRSDYTAATVWLETHDKKHYLAHASRIRKEFNDMVKWIEHLAKVWNVDQILVEDRGAGTQYIQVRKEQPGFAPVIPISTKQQSKEFRFDGVTPMFAAGEVFLPESGNDWIADVEQELFVFPNGKNDDYVDSVGQYLAHSRKGGTRNRGTQKMNTGFRQH
jgi:predicted phage terminase large subunit-like protein